MDNAVTVTQIEETKTYKLLNPIQKTFALKRQNRELLTNGLIVFKNSSIVPGTIQGYNVGILNDLITNTKQP